MEGAGSRRSRYASSPSPPVFNGPVRKWKKQWVSTLSNNQNQNIRNKRNDAAPLLLCRWTPLSATDEPPRRRFRYTPIVPIEKGNMKNFENEAGASLRNQANNGAGDSDGMLEKPSTGDISKEEAEELSEDRADSNRSLVIGSYSEEKGE